MKLNRSLQLTDNGDVPIEGSIGVAETPVAVEASSAQLSHDGGDDFWDVTGNSRRQGLCGGQSGCGTGGGVGDGSAGSLWC